MVSSVYTVSFLGLEAEKVEVQVHIGDGLPSFAIVGLANKAVAESKERIRSAFSSMGLALPAKRITVNLAPADLQKEGTHYDLPIAIAILVKMEIIPQEEVSEYIFLGEISLDSSIKKVPGVLPAAIWSNNRKLGLVCPFENRQEAHWSGNENIINAKHILALVNHFSGKKLIISEAVEVSPVKSVQYADLQDIRGQKIGKRALEIAAAGGHNMLMLGPPGSGKSMLAKRLPGIIPTMSKEEILEVSIIASIAGSISDNGLIVNRPFKSPHCSASLAAMIGGGKDAKPGEITLAHLGILFMDELPEFQRNVLEALRQPIEDRKVSISRVNNHVSYPADFQLIAAMNPCKCGYFGSNRLQCNRAPKCAQDYKNKISGPLFDRFDLQIEVAEIDMMDTQYHDLGETSEQVLKRVNKAQLCQQKRYEGLQIRNNAQLEGKKLEEFISINKHNQEIIKKAMEKFNLSMRGLSKVLKVARTIADLDGDDIVTPLHIGEALSYRIKVKG